MSPLRGLPRLRELYLGSTGVTDLAPLVALPSLQRLRVGWNHAAPVSERPPGLRKANAAALAELVKRGVDVECTWPQR